MHLAERFSILPTNSKNNILTSKDIARSILGEVDVACNRSREITDANLDAHAESALVLTCKVISEPNASISLAKDVALMAKPTMRQFP